MIGPHFRLWHRTKDPKGCRLGPGRAHGDYELIKLRNEQCSTCAGGCGNTVSAAILVTLSLEDINASGTAGYIDALVFRVGKHIVGVAACFERSGDLAVSRLENAEPGR